MRCVACNRPLNEPTVWYRSSAGPLAFGPKCARRAGLWPLPAESRPQRRRPRAHAAPPNAHQLDLFTTQTRTA